MTKDDLREVAQIQDLGAMEALTLLLAEHSAQQLVYSNLSREVGIAVDTARRWVDLLARLHYGFLVRHLRDKLKREVDFLVVRDRKPWFLVEVKNRDERLSDALGYFQQQTQARHAFQVVIEKRFENADCFARTDPVVVPARTLLSQLL